MENLLALEQTQIFLLTFWKTGYFFSVHRNQQAQKNVSAIFTGVLHCKQSEHIIILKAEYQ